MTNTARQSAGPHKTTTHHHPGPHPIGAGRCFTRPLKGPPMTSSSLTRPKVQRGKITPYWFILFPDETTSYRATWKAALAVALTWGGARGVEPCS